MAEWYGTDRELAQRLFDEWNHGLGVSKSELERRVWGDGSSHGRRFDRFVEKHLGVRTTGRSRQTDRIGDLERQVRSMGAHPVGVDPSNVEIQLQHSRAACLSALRIWNDPAGDFRTSGFALHFVTAWNSLALAVLQRGGVEWRRLEGGEPVVRNGMEESLGTSELVAAAFTGDAHRGLRENVHFWVDLRNAVAHRYLPGLDIPVIPYAQAGLLNFERVITDEFGDDYQLAEKLTVPLQLSGFRDPQVLASRQRAQAALPLDVQVVLARAGLETPELLADETFQMRVAFVPVVPSSGRNPDVVAYFVPPEQITAELKEALEHFFVLPKPVRGQKYPFGAKAVVSKVGRRIPFKFNTRDHLAAARRLKVRPLEGEPDGDLELLYGQYQDAAKIYAYNQRWVDRLVDELQTAEGYYNLIGRDPVVRNDAPRG